MKPVKNIRLAVITILGVACSLSAFAGTYSTAANKTLATKIAKRVRCAHAPIVCNANQLSL